MIEWIGFESCRKIYSRWLQLTWFFFKLQSLILYPLILKTQIHWFYAYFMFRNFLLYSDLSSLRSQNSQQINWKILIKFESWIVEFSKSVLKNFFFKFHSNNASKFSRFFLFIPSISSIYSQTSLILIQFVIEGNQLQLFSLIVGV